MKHDLLRASSVLQKLTNVKGAFDGSEAVTLRLIFEGLVTFTLSFFESVVLTNPKLSVFCGESLSFQLVSPRHGRLAKEMQNTNPNVLLKKSLKNRIRPPKKNVNISNLFRIVLF